MVINNHHHSEEEAACQPHRITRLASPIALLLRLVARALSRRPVRREGARERPPPGPCHERIEKSAAHEFPSLRAARRFAALVVASHGFRDDVAKTTAKLTRGCRRALELTLAGRARFVSGRWSVSTEASGREASGSSRRRARGVRSAACANEMATQLGTIKRIRHFPGFNVDGFNYQSPMWRRTSLRTSTPITRAGYTPDSRGPRRYTAPRSPPRS